MGGGGAARRARRLEPARGRDLSRGAKFRYRLRRLRRRRLHRNARCRRAPAGLSTGQAWYDWYVAVQPNDANTVYLGAIDIYRGDHGAGGWAWTDISSKAAAGTDSIHPDQHALAFDPVDPNMIYAGNDGGLFRSPDRGTHWVHRNHSLAITEIEYIAQDFGSVRWVMGGTQDNGTDRYVGSMSGITSPTAMAEMLGQSREPQYDLSHLLRHARAAVPTIAA
jgi:hypothetical protein